ncbi:synaptotagmin-4-like [Olea europaea var. sylvestris]|uniref:synaptotagmin-4-like n=1 Tax=Olea europaea var. sylvestris TaxID=158386 RepID=UPI000C1D0C62|nr:synaptotagmin-4-like [Olea europaea var. sylvestris]
MGFLAGYVLGVAAGIGLIIGFARYQNIRSKRRTDLAEAIAAFARMTVDDSRKILPNEFYPSWVVFSQRQKLTWLNQHLEKLWPYVNEAASELIRNSVEPTLDAYRPVILASLKFSKLTLGTVAPKFTGVSIIEGDAREIIMELELQWDGNPNIVLDVKTIVGVGLPVQVKNIGFTGVFRIIFKPLVDEFPCFGAVCYSLREKKNLDFTLKVVGGDVSAIPGISDTLEATIRDAIEDSITWPVRKIIPILPGDYSYLELKPVGILEVKLIQAKELSNKDIIGKSDPFAKLFVRPLRDRMKSSKTISNSTNPIWNEHFGFVVEDESTQHLTIRIYDDEGIQAAELIGCAQVALKDLEPGKVKDVWLKLVKDLEIQRDQKNRGQVHLELLYCPYGTESAFMNPDDPDFRLTMLEKVLNHGSDGIDKTDPIKSRKDPIVRGVLSMTVISAEDLPSTDLMGKSDPFVEIILKKSEQKNRTRNKLGKCIMTLTRIILEGEVMDSFPLDGAESGRLNLHLKWTPQPIMRD